MSNLLLQKPSKNSKAKDYLKAVARRMQSWLKGDLMELLRERETIQKKLTKGDQRKLTKGDIGNISKKFAALMRKENVNAAINLLIENIRKGINETLNNETLHLLRLKHSDPKMLMKL